MSDDEDEPVERLERALEMTDDRDVEFYIRQALQLMTLNDSPGDSDE